MEAPRNIIIMPHVDNHGHLATHPSLLVHVVCEWPPTYKENGDFAHPIWKASTTIWASSVYQNTFRCVVYDGVAKTFMNWQIYINRTQFVLSSAGFDGFRSKDDLWWIIFTDTTVIELLATKVYFLLFFSILTSFKSIDYKSFWFSTIWLN